MVFFYFLQLSVSTILVFLPTGILIQFLPFAFHSILTAHLGIGKIHPDLRACEFIDEKYMIPPRKKENGW